MPVIVGRQNPERLNSLKPPMDMDVVFSRYRGQLCALVMSQLDIPAEFAQDLIDYTYLRMRRQGRDLTAWNGTCTAIDWLLGELRWAKHQFWCDQVGSPTQRHVRWAPEWFDGIPAPDSTRAVEDNLDLDYARARIEALAGYGNFGCPAREAGFGMALFDGIRAGKQNKEICEEFGYCKSNAARWMTLFGDVGRAMTGEVEHV